MRTKRLKNGSISRGPLPEGCKMCEKGAKMVLLITGTCKADCYYCPLSDKKKGKNVVYADEALVHDDEGIISEAKSIDAEGTGITGGDPLVSLEKTAHAIRLLKKTFGKGHHIHLYTVTTDKSAIKAVANAGLDEIRFHPFPIHWDDMEKSEFPDAMLYSKELGMSCGVEVPVLPDMKNEMHSLMSFLSDLGIDFVNLNELEFSETNFDQLKKKGFTTKSEVSSAAMGGEELAIELIKGNWNMPVHYCSSSFKDGVQLRNRITRRAQNIAMPYEAITKDGTLIKGIIESESAEDIAKALKEKHKIADKFFALDRENKKIEIAPWILDRIFREFEGAVCYIIEEYPTADRLEVERIPLKR